MADEKIIVQLASPERKYVRTYHDFLDNSFLTTEEQMIFIVLKSYIDFREDSGEAFPSIDTLCKRAKMSKPRTIKAINNLIKKGIVKKVQRGLTKTNLYTLSDYVTMWACDNVEDVAAIADNQGVKPLTPAEHIAELERMGYKVSTKEKGLDNEPTKAHYQAPQLNNFNQSNDTSDLEKSQAKTALEKFPLHQIQEFFGSEAMAYDFPHLTPDITAAMEILHDTLNSNKPTIRINGEDKPALVVTSKLMRLSKEPIIYAIEKFREQTDRIKNPKAYMLTLLYNAPEQYALDITNQVQHDMHN